MVKKLRYFLLFLACLLPLMAQPQTKKINKKHTKIHTTQKKKTTRKKIKKATYYHDKFENRKTSSGELFSQSKYTAAHRSIPLNTIVKVTNTKNGRSVLVKINDRCRKGGVIDLSKVAAERLQIMQNGSAPVKIEIMGDNYLAIWEKQDEMFALFDRSRENDSLRNAKLDSGIFSNTVQNTDRFLFANYIHITTAENKDVAKRIIERLPEKYKYMTKVVQAKNKKFYYINMGPFVSIKTAENIVNELKDDYPLTHILDKKNAE
jgi:rare lipoprotein A